MTPSRNIPAAPGNRSFHWPFHLGQTDPMGSVLEKTWAKLRSHFIWGNRGSSGPIFVAHCDGAFFQQPQTHKMESAWPLGLNQWTFIKKIHP